MMMAPREMVMGPWEMVMGPWEMVEGPGEIAAGVSTVPGGGRILGPLDRRPEGEVWSFSGWVSPAASVHG